VVRVNGITSVMTFPASGGRGGGGGFGGGGARQYISGQAALIHMGRLDLGRHGDQPQRRDAIGFSEHADSWRPGWR